MVNIQDILAKMLNLKLVVMLREPTRKQMLDDDLIEHLEWMIAREKEGLVFASGPFITFGAPPGTSGGLTILRVSGLEQAREIAETDPLVARGVITYQLREWLLMEGGITVKVSFSDGAASVA
jgi:uncharacterized protein YciI